jgi:hypothetical protein
MIHNAKQPVFYKTKFPGKKIGRGNSICQQDFPFLSRILHFLLYTASIFTLPAVNQYHPGWTDGISFSVPVLTKAVGRLTLFYYPFAALISVFVLELFFLPTHHSGFFFFSHFETFPPTYLLSPTYPTHPHLPTPLYI